METGEFFKYLGFKSYTDIDYNSKGKINFDLGKPIPKKWHGQADILYDGGTIEHIPNILQAVTNAVHLVKKGGIVIHHVPFGDYGNCYYNIDPIFFKDFFQANGFEVVDCFLFYDCSSIFKKLFKYVEQTAVNYVKPRYPNLFKNLKGTSIGQSLSARVKPMKTYDKTFRRMGKLRLNYYAFFGFPSGTHVAFIGRKKENLDEIGIPCQEVYPNQIKADSNNI